MTETAIVATIVWNTEADGTPVADDVAFDDMPRCHYGPFATEADAARWLTEDYPDGDTDVHDDLVERVPVGTIINDPGSIRG